MTFYKPILTTACLVQLLASLLQAAEPTTSGASSKLPTLRAHGINVLPRPAHVEPGEGKFTLNSQTVILASPGLERIGRYLAEALGPATRFKLEVASSATTAPGTNVIQLRLSAPSESNPGAGSASTLGEEGYELQVLPDRILLQAPKPVGVFYACQTLRQLFPTQLESQMPVTGVEWSAPVVRIKDQPQFVWRGLMLDPGRRFISKQALFKQLDVMAFHKMNRLHLHLDDSEGWRVQIKKYPRLTEIGAWTAFEDGAKIGGYYSREDLNELIAYAADRFITVIPEIEAPSHSGAVMVAYPELNCLGFRKQMVPPCYPDPLGGAEFCAGNDQVFEFFDGMLTEVAELFPGPYIHLGGDEAEMYLWGRCPKCQKRIADEKLGSVWGLHNWFMNRLNQIVQAKGKRAIGWAGIAKGAIYTCWDSHGDAGWSAAKDGWDVIMSPGYHYYLNWGLEATSLKDSYAFDPAPRSAALTPAQRQHILGVEACQWGEHCPEGRLNRQMFPRLLATAERGWGVEEADFDDFLERVKVHVERLAGLGVLTGPGFPYQPVPALPARFWLAVPPLSRSFYHNEPGEDMRWKGGGLGIQETLYPMEAFDGDLESYYLTYGPRRDTETITLVLDKPDTFDHVQAITGFPNGDLILRQGALDVSEDLRVWREVAPFHNGVAEAKLNGEPVRAVRLRSTVSQDMYDWLAVREIVLEKNGESTLKRIAPVERLMIPGTVKKGNG